MARPVCSIIIPTRDCLNYLPTALASIDVQTVSGLEVILVDDGSSDGTAAWARQRPASGFALTVLETGGIGPGAARNAGVEIASADLVAFLDADDQWLAGKLESQLACHAANPDTGLSFSDYVHATPDGRTRGTCFEYWRCSWTGAAGDGYAALPGAEAKLLAANVVGTSAAVVNRAVFKRAGGFSSACRSAEDWDLWLRLAALAPVACTGAVAMSYLMRPGSETTNRRGRIEAMRAIIARYEERREPGFIQAVREAKARCDVAEAELARSTGDSAGAAAAHLRAMLAKPGWRTGRALASDIAGILAAPFRTAAAHQ